MILRATTLGTQPVGLLVYKDRGLCRENGHVVIAYDCNTVTVCSCEYLFENRKKNGRLYCRPHFQMLNTVFGILIRISLNLVPKALNDDALAFVQVKALWRLNRYLK